MAGLPLSVKYSFFKALGVGNAAKGYSLGSRSERWRGGWNTSGGKEVVVVVVVVITVVCVVGA